MKLLTTSPQPQIVGTTSGYVQTLWKETTIITYEAWRGRGGEVRRGRAKI